MAISILLIITIVILACLLVKTNSVDNSVELLWKRFVADYDDLNLHIVRIEKQLLTKEREIIELNEEIKNLQKSKADRRVKKAKD